MLDQMGFDEDRRVVTCDLFGCRNELPIPPDVGPVEHGEDHPDWSYHAGRGLWRCPEHPIKDSWLS